MKIRPFKICLWLSILTILAGLAAPVPLAAADPAVSTAAATNVDDNSATLHGELTDLGDIGTVYVYFEYGTTEGGPYQETDHQEMSATGPFQAVINDLSPETTYYYRAVAEVDGTEFAGTEMSFTTTAAPNTNPPIVEGNSPDNGAVDVPINTTIAVTFNKAMNQESAEEAFSINPDAAGTFAWNGTKMTYTPSSNLAYSQTYQVTISTLAEDPAGNNLEAAHTFSFTTEAEPDTISPAVVGNSPDNGAINVPVNNTTITVNFDEAMDQTATQGTFSINPETEGNFSWDDEGKVLTFRPLSNLTNSTEYTVTISTEAKDLAGNSLETEYTFSFTTAALDTAPGVTSTSPAHQAVNIPVNATIAVIFSEAMDKDTTQGAFSINPAVDGSFSWNETETVMIFNPGSNLAYSQAYQVTISTAAQDLTGNNLEAAHTFSFTTAAAPTTPPSSGGGGGGGGGSTATIGLTGWTSPTALKTGNSGTRTAAQLKSTDGKLTLELNKGTRITRNAREMVSALTLEALTNPPVPPSGNAVVLAYNFGPDGATFTPAARLSFSYDPASLLEGMSEEDLYIAYWDGAAWTPLKTTVDPAAHKISVEIDHFSIFGLLGRVTLPTPTPGSINTPGQTNPALTPAPVQTTPPASIPAAAAPATSPGPTPPAEGIKKEEPPVKPVYWVVMVLVIMVAVAAFTVFKISSNKNKIDEGKM